MILQVPQRKEFDARKHEKKYLQVIENAYSQAHLEGEGQLIQDKSQLIKYIDKCIENGEHVLDLETTGLNTFQDRIVGACLYTPGEVPSYIPVNHTDFDLKLLPNQLEESFVKEQLGRLEGKAINHNMKFDGKFLRWWWGIDYSEYYWDTQIGAFLLNENETSHGLKPLWARYVKKTKDVQAFKELFQKMPFNFVPLELAKIYGANDGLKTYQLYQFQKGWLNPNHKRQDFRDLHKLFRELEMPLIPALVEMESRGVEVDLNRADELEKEYIKVTAEAKGKLNDIIKKVQYKIDKHEEMVRLMKGEEINFNSHKQVSALVYDILQFPVVVRKEPRTTGKKAQEVWVEMDLKPIQKEFLDAFLEWRKFSKLLKDFIQKIPNAVEEGTNAVHTEFNQTGTKTGRFSSSHPIYKMNLQQIPSRGEHKKIRQIFHAREGYAFVGSDLSQAEPRILTVLGGVKKMREAYETGMDLYSLMASDIFNKAYEECMEFHPVTGKKQPEGKALRDQVKSVLLGLMYGRQPASIANQFGKPAKWGEELFRKFFDKYPEVEETIIQSEYMASKLGYVTTIEGRKRRLPNMKLPKDDWRYIADTRKCLNARIQGSCADLIKKCTVIIHNSQEFRKLGAYMVLNIHDEIILECPRKNAKQAGELLAKTMKQVVYDALQIPQKCDVEIMEAWAGEDISDQL